MIQQLKTLYEKGLVRAYYGDPNAYRRIAAEQVGPVTYVLRHVREDQYEVLKYIRAGHISIAAVLLKGVVYIAGPMRGRDLNNFPAFDAARDFFIQKGYYVFNPADMDRMAGITELTVTPLPNWQLRDCFDRDLNAICRSTHIALLPGWENSRGVRPESVLANEIEVIFLNATTGEEVPATAVCAVVGGRLVAEYTRTLKQGTIDE